MEAPYSHRFPHSPKEWWPGAVQLCLKGDSEQQDNQNQLCLNTVKYFPGLGNALPTPLNVRCVLKLDSDVSRLCSFKVNPVFRDSWNLQLPWNMLLLQLQLQVPLSYLFPVIPDRLGKYISFLMKHNIVFKWFLSNCFQFLINSWFLNISLFVPYVSLKSLLPVQQKIHK